MDITLRQATVADAPIVVRFNSLLAAETENKSLDQVLLRQGVEALLGNPSKGLYFLAELDGTVVGQTMITYEWSDWRNGTFWWIQSVFVTPDARRAGVFRALFRHLESLAEGDRSVCGIRLYVERENERAQATYRRCGLEDGGYRVMEVDYSGAVQPARGTNHA